MGNWIRRNLVTVLMVGGMLVGVFLLVYPSVANYWNSFHSTQAISTYTDVVTKMDKKDYKKILDSAHAYNERLAQTGMRWVMTDAEKEAYQNPAYRN